MDRGRVTPIREGRGRGVPPYQEGGDEQVNRRSEREVLRESVADGVGCGGAGVDSAHRVALMRPRNTVGSASRTFTRNGRIAVLSVACSLPCRIALGVMASSP